MPRPYKPARQGLAAARVFQGIEDRSRERLRGGRFRLDERGVHRPTLFNDFDAYELKLAVSRPSGKFALLFSNIYMGKREYGLSNRRMIEKVRVGNF